MKLYCPECKETFDDVTLASCPRDDARLFVLEDEAQDPLLGAIIDQRFRIESKLGQGGMGAVYAATQLSVGRTVAVKVLKKELVDREVALERFYRESKLTSELSHPNIVKLIDFGQDRERDLLYLVMELVSGVNMSDLLERGRMRVSLALEIVYQVCGALTEPHALGIIHRDLKPDNMLIVPISDGTIQVKVLDFGIARALEANTQLTATGMVCGTPAYMAPEQAQNQEIGPQTDLYALGVILYEMLCGVPPFQGQNSLQIMLQHIQIAPKPLSNYIPPSTLPDEVEELVHDLLSKDTAGRPKNARVVRTTIEKIRRLYNLEPVRIDPDLPHEHLFDDLLLAAMPGVSNISSRTEALRRETNLERQMGASTYTTDERNQIALAETSLESAPELELVTVPAHTALDYELAEDARIQSTRREPPQLTPLPPVKRPDAAHTPTPEARSAAPSTHTHPTADASGGKGIKVLAAGILLLVVAAAVALVALVATSPADTAKPAPKDETTMTVKAIEKEAPSTAPLEEKPAKALAPVVTSPVITNTPDMAAPTQPAAIKETPPEEIAKKPAPTKPAEKKTTSTKKVAQKPDPPKEKPTPSTDTTTPPTNTADLTAPPKKSSKPEPKEPAEKKEEKTKSLGNLFGTPKKSTTKRTKDHFEQP